MMVRQAALFLVLALAGLIGPAVSAQSAVGIARPGDRHVPVELIAETDTPAAGGAVDLAFVARPKPGWHGYWQNPGDAGSPTTLKWTLPGGLNAGPLRYPVPERLLVAGLMNYVYERPYTQFVRLTLPAGLAAGTKLPVRVRIDHLVCTREICVPEFAELSVDLTVGDGAISAERRARFDGWRKHLPKPLGSDAAFQRVGDRFRLGVPFPAGAAGAEAYFYPLSEGAIDYAAPQTVSRDGDRMVIETRAGSAKPAEVSGVLAVGEQGFAIRALPGTVAPGAAAGEGDASGGMTALWAFLFAVAGGLLLNVMPCVFPILSLKALSLAKSGESDSQARGEALAYTAGVVAVCVALGGVLLALRAGGASVGWGFQLADPRVILVLLLLVTGIAFNLAGLFELAAPAAANRLAARGNGSAFMTGALAAIIATPCTGPFMGFALGAALVLPTWAALAVFAGLGLGIALPFLLIGFVPALRRRLPRPGAWMETFRHILAVPMFATALALAWLVGQLGGVAAMTVALGAAIAFALILWLIGRRQARGAGVAALTALLLAVTIAGAWWVGPARAQGSASVAPLGTEPFSEARLAALRAQGKPVFAYFTADWCLTCKVNEKVAIETDAVRSAFAKGGVTVLVGDWTDGNAELGRFIEKHNRAGVPLYLWYDGKVGGEPRVLPQVLTPAMLTGLVQGE